MKCYFINMNYSLTDLPDSGNNPIVYMDISLKGELLGRIFIRLFRDVFPAGVENFIRIASGKTYKIIKKGNGIYNYTKQINRSYNGSKFFNLKYNNYIVAGDIYNNDGSNAGTIYNDKPIPADFGEFYYPHESKGLISLIPFRDEESKQLFYDSTFMITLDNIKPTNVLNDLDKDQIVIGQVYSGLDVLNKMNELIKPFAGRKYPEFVISKSDSYHTRNSSRRLRPLKINTRQKFIVEPTIEIDQFDQIDQPDEIDMDTNNY
jgi:cyclophilin family peptidyl-prolyl cis-trans isomerase